MWLCFVRASIPMINTDLPTMKNTNNLVPISMRPINNMFHLMQQQHRTLLIRCHRRWTFNLIQQRHHCCFFNAADDEQRLTYFIQQQHHHLQLKKPTKLLCTINLESNMHLNQLILYGHTIHKLTIPVNGSTHVCIVHCALPKLFKAMLPPIPG